MSKNWVKYSVFVLVAFLVSCGAPEMDKFYDEMSKEESATEEKVVYAEALDSYHEEEAYVEDSVGFDTAIAPEMAIALEERARQKVKELFDYMLIASNADYDKEMRRKAMKMAIALFDSKAQIQSPILTGRNEFIKIKSALKMVFNDKISIENIQITSMSVADKIQCEILLNTSQNMHLAIDFTMKKEEKQFGNTTQEVWSVYLGNVIEN